MLSSQFWLSMCNESDPQSLHLLFGRVWNLVFCSWVDFLAVVLAGFRTGPRKPGKSWNFIMAFSRTGKSWKKAIGPGKFWQSVKTQLKNMKCMEGSKEN